MGAERPHLVTVDVESFSHSGVGDEQLDTAGLPFADDFFRGKIPVVVTHVPGTRNGQLASLGSDHGRSYEVIMESPEGDAESDNAIWTDQYGNVFTALNTKGNNFSKPDVIRSGTAPSGYMLYGLQEDDALSRIVASSNIMRAAGVDTEWIVRLEEPKELLFTNEFIEPREYKRLLLNRYLGGHAVEGATQQRGIDIGPIPVDDKVARKIARAVKDMNFFITLRAMSANERLGNLFNRGQPDFDKLSETYELYNLVAPLRQADFEMLGLPPRLELEKATAQDVMPYFVEIIPKLLGCNLARMHAAGLAHVFPHSGNIGALGALVDNDSVKGGTLGLGDKPITIEDKVKDLSYPFNREHFDNLLPFLTSYEGPLPDGSRRADKVFLRNLLNAYATTWASISQPVGGNMSALEVLIHLGESEDLDEAARLAIDETYDMAGETIDRRVNSLGQENQKMNMTELARHVYKTSVAGSEKSLGEDVMTAKPPTVDDFDKALLAWLGVRDYVDGVVDGGPLVHDELFESKLVPYLMDKVRDRVKADVKSVLPDIRAELAGSGLEDLSDQSLAALYSIYVSERHGYSELDLSRTKEFWAAMFEEFHTNYTDTLDFGLVPEQGLIDDETGALEPYKAMWHIHHEKVMRGCGNVPEAVATSVLRQSPTVSHVNSKAEILRVTFKPNEALRLIVTDADVARCYDDFDFTEDANGQEAYHIELPKPPLDQPTYGLFLLENMTDHSFRLVFNKCDQASQL